jgi:RHS repeat-associated protein
LSHECASCYTSNRLNQLTSYTTAQGGTTTTTTPTYDLSGNMTNVPIGQGGLTYSYDEANRLVQIVQRDSSGVYTKKSDFLYDGLSRKVISREYSWINGAWVAQSEVRRVYDGLQVVQERDSSNAISTNYTRGRDLSGAMRRAGGMEGLLARSTAGGHFYYHYDGHGNVVQLTSATAQGTAAEYTYDAFGRTLTASGAQATANTYRFNTKEVHLASGLVDFGYRFYSPSLGRWLNRDPIVEQGGLNLYSFVYNSPTNLIDPDGKNPLVVIGAVVGAIVGFVGSFMYELMQLIKCGDPINWPLIMLATFAGALGGAILGLIAGPLTTALANAVGGTAPAGAAEGIVSLLPEGVKATSPWITGIISGILGAVGAAAAGVINGLGTPCPTATPPSGFPPGAGGGSGGGAAVLGAQVVVLERGRPKSICGIIKAYYDWLELVSTCHLCSSLSGYVFADLVVWTCHNPSTHRGSVLGSQ